MQCSVLNWRSTRDLLAVGLLATIAIFVVVQSRESHSDEPAPATGSDPRPVILLTGFEPFGGRPQNVSWEGIKALDGAEFQGHRIVCRELPVVWDAPLTHLREWTDELNPVAIFSFGEGRAHGFDIETRAFDQRGRIPDNDGETPSNALIVADGPERYEATIDHSALHEQLVALGHPVHVSTNAGRYLCEECLYSLEHVRVSQATETDVMFCHVPPLGVVIDGETVTADFVQNYVEDLLESWRALSDTAFDPADDDVPTESATSQPGDSGEEDNPREAEVESFIRTYFSSWSDRDLRTYGSCFATGSSVQYIENSRIRLYELGSFLELQAEVHRRSRVPLRETPETIEIAFEQDLARVVVYWKLVAGSRLEYGYDHFTLMKVEDDWKIVNLIFYSTPESD